MRFGYYSRCVLVEVRESAMEAWMLQLNMDLKRLEVKVIDVRAPLYENSVG